MDIALGIGLGLLENLMVFLLFHFLFYQSRLSKNYYLLWCIYIVLISIVVGINNSSIGIKAIIIFWLLFSSIRVLYKCERYIASVFSLICIFYLYILDIICGTLFSILFSQNFLQLLFHTFTNRLIISLVVKIINGIVFYALFRMFKKIYLDIRKRDWGLLNASFGVFLLLSILFMTTYPSVDFDAIEGLLYFSVALGVFIVSIVLTYFFCEVSASFFRDKRNLVLKNNYMILEQQLLIQEQINEKMRKVRHDLKNLVGEATVLIGNGEGIHAVNLLKQLNGEVSELSVALEHYTGNNDIDAAVCYKANYCEENNIAFRYELEAIPSLNIRSIEISAIIMNLLDNAIEATIKAEKPKIVLKIFGYKHFVVINLENTYGYSLKTKNGKFITTKKDADKHGLGRGRKFFCVCGS